MLGTFVGGLMSWAEVGPRGGDGARRELSVVDW